MQLHPTSLPMQKIGLNNLKIGLRFSIAFGLVFLLMVAIAIVGVMRLSEIAKAAAHMELASQRENLASQWAGQSDLHWALTEAKMRSTDPEDEAALDRKLEMYDLQISRAIDTLASLVTEKEDRLLLLTAIRKRKEYMAHREDALQSLDARKMHPLLRII